MMTWQKAKFLPRGTVSTAMIYTFDDTKDNGDWNGFYSLTNIEANSTGARGISTALELQITNFDLGIDEELDGIIGALSDEMEKEYSLL